MADADTDRVWDLIKKIGICMLATWDGHQLHARPMGAYVRREDNAIFFLTDARRHKDAEIKQYPKVCLSFADTSGQKYVSLAGHAEVLNDRSMVRDLWGTPAKAWWDSPDDPSIRILKVTPQDAEYWDSPGTTVSYVKMAAAAITGLRPDMGDNRKVAMR
jgi:general stress protein 26